MKEQTVVEKLRDAMSWLNYLDENFNSNFKDANSIVKLWENCNTDTVDNLWPYLKPGENGEYDEDAIDDAKLVNEAFGKEYYPIPKQFKYLYTQI